MLCLFVCVACNDDESATEPPDPPPTCDEGMVRTAGGCFFAGVPPDACAEGFEPADAGCRVVLPAEPCAPGSMTLPGDTSCREVVPCGAPPYGDIPVDDTTEFVDAAYGGTDSDGTIMRPWRTIQEAVDAAMPGAIVAVPAGSYLESVVITGKPVRLWGRCPALSEIRGAGNFSVVEVLQGASATEIRGLAIRSDEVEYGIGMSGATDVLVEGVWVHDTQFPGVQADVGLAPTSLTIRGSLIEAAGGMGVYMHGATVLVESTEVRNSREDSLGGVGRGITGVAHEDQQTRAMVRVRRSLIRQIREAGIVVEASDLEVEATAILDTLPSPDQPWAAAVAAQGSPTTAEKASLTISSSVIERSHNIGISVLGADASIDTTVVRDTRQGGGQQYDSGISLQFAFETMVPSTVSIRSTLVERSSLVGIAVTEATATIDATWVRETAIHPSDGLYGDGLMVYAPFNGASAQVTRSRIEHSARAGVLSAGAALSLGESALECNPIQLNGEPFGGHPFTFNDLGGNACGCSGDPVECSVRSSGLSPPDPIP